MLVNSPVLNSDGLSRHRRALPALTGVRFIAAFYVVVFHALPWLQQRFALPQTVHTFLGNGYLAVSLFFILSGFILTYTYEGQIEGKSNRIHFWEARFARIYPVYFLSLILALWFEPGLSLRAKIAVLAMVQAWNPRVPELTGAWNYPAWSLSVEIFFYLFFPFVLPWMSKLSRRWLVWLIAMLAAGSVLLHTPVQGLGISDKNSLLTNYIPLPILRLPEFLLGMAVGLKLLRREASGELSGSSARAYLAVLASIAVLSLPLGAWVSLVTVPFAVLVYELAVGRSLLARLLSTKLMVLLGSASYAVYLLQFPVRSWTRVFFSHVFPGWTNLGTALTPFILVLFSILMFCSWEEPCRKALRSYFAARKFSPTKMNSTASASNVGN